MIMNQLRLFLSDKIEAERRGTEKAKMLFKKNERYLLYHNFPRMKIIDLLKAFWYTEWYDLERLKGLWVARF